MEMLVFLIICLSGFTSFLIALMLTKLFLTKMNLSLSFLVFVLSLSVFVIIVLLFSEFLRIHNLEMFAFLVYYVLGSISGILASELMY